MASSAYKESMQRILRYIGLEGYGHPDGRMGRRDPAHTVAVEANRAEATVSYDEHSARNTHRPVSRKKRKVDPNSPEYLPDFEVKDPTATIYLSFEDTVEWRAFMMSIPPSQRYIASARRRLCMIFWRSHKKGQCLFCWMPRANCICEALEARRQLMPQAAVIDCAPSTMLLHPEELMRSTNSGHIAAILLDAPVRVWGLPEDDTYMAELPATEMQTVDGRCVETLNTTLYPAEGADTVEMFIKAHVAVAPAAGNAPPPQQRVHLVLLDSTWNQATSLNRHIAAAVPRMALVIPPSYEARFARLRKRTRETGVSTLEATTMAIEQCLTAMGRPAEAAQATAQLLAAMEDFVDVKCLLKFTEAEFTKDPAAVAEITRRRDIVRREESHRRQEQLEQRVIDSAKARWLLLPPVCNYCYCCNRAVGWHRMPEHVLGRPHRAALADNPTCEPSATSAKDVVPDYSRPMRTDRRDRTRGELTEEAAEAFSSGQGLTGPL